jgi:tetratricopeptide (TPR) repeat protein
MQRRQAACGLVVAWVLCASLVVLAGARASAASEPAQIPVPAQQAYDRSDYGKAVQELLAAAAADPRNGDVQLWLTKSYLELQEYDAAINSAEKAVAIDPDSSVYHQWLGKAYGEKASRASMFSAMNLAKKTHKEFETAVRLDEKNYGARQALIEFDCSAPGMVGGGDEKAKLEIEKLHGMDAAEWHYAEGNCRRQKKDYSGADQEFQKALGSGSRSADLIYDIGDYAMKRGQADRLIEVASLGEKAAPNDPRGKFYRAAGLILKNENLDEAQSLLQQYLRTAPKRDAYPRYAVAHEWLARAYEDKGDKNAAVKEYQQALQLEPKDKNARDALKRLEKG